MNLARKISHIMLQVLFLIFTSLMLILLVFLIASCLHDGQAVVAGCRLHTVLSGSMAPAVPAGSLIVVKVIDPAELKLHDIVLFQDPVKDRLPIMHRIVAISGQEELIFVTKGDANRVHDPIPVSSVRVQGKLLLHIPLLGRLIQFSQTRSGLIYLVILPALLIILNELHATFRPGSRRSKNRDTFNAVEDA